MKISEQARVGDIWVYPKGKKTSRLYLVLEKHIPFVHAGRFDCWDLNAHEKAIMTFESDPSHYQLVCRLP